MVQGTKQQQASTQRNISGSGQGVKQGVKRSGSGSSGGDGGNISGSGQGVKQGVKRSRSGSSGGDGGSSSAADVAHSGYRGVTQHVRTQKWEAHIWEGGKQQYLGGWDTAAKAALAFDIAGA